ncbi:MAG: sigma-54-dependent Fis family transcriptional regulator [Candidatus Latescibacterota bacterium]|nr:MAG: sigma-54-dependent Fis family transcriptional regulator [Candidatus Latescibacterota bacterium]
MERVLIVDDEDRMRKILKVFLEDKGFEVEEADCGRAAVETSRRFRPQVVVMDLVMPDMSGIDAMTEVFKFLPDCKVIFITAYGSVDSAVEAMKKGAYDYITKPFKNDDLLMRIERALEEVRLRGQVEVLKGKLDQRYGLDEIVGVSSCMREVFDLVLRAAPRDVTVLITGETGTGKELIAKAIHRHSGRGGKFVAINCSAIPEGLIESELFGHERGAFTDAKGRKVGKFEEADGGTLFLDEVCYLSPQAQLKLLRAIQEREITRLGGKGSVKVDVRIVCATSQDPLEMVRQGRFKEELYYRLNVFPIHVPPLRERREDIPLLVEHFVGKYNGILGTQVVGVSEEAMGLLLGYDWPGNVRELENIIQNAMIMAEEGIITPDDLPERIRGAGRMVGKDVGLKEAVEDVEKRLIQKVLREEGGNKTRAAKRLGISRQTLLNKMAAYGIE